MRVILVCWLALVSIAGLAQSDWIAQAGPYGGIVYDVEYDASSGWTYALIDSYIYHSQDNGDTWTRSDSFVSGVDIEIGNGTVYVLQGFNVYTSPAGQDNFVDVTVDFDLNGSKLKRMANGTLISAGQFAIYYSTDNGANWAANFGVAGETFIPATLEVSSDNKVLIINSTGAVRVSSNNGALFTTISFTPIATIAGTPTSLATNNARTTLFISTTTNLYETPATANGLGALTSIKGTISSTTISSATYPSIVEVASNGTDMFFVDNFNHRIYKKTVVAGSWSQLQFPDNPRIIKNSTAVNGTEFLLGTFTGLYKSTDTGSSYYQANGGVTGVRPIKMGTFGNTLYINSEAAGLYYSFDDGYTWQGEPRVPGPVESFTWSKDYQTNAVYGAFALKHTTAGSASDLYRTKVEGGFTNWTLLASVPEFEWVDMMDQSRAIGMTFGANSPLYYSHDMMTTWATITVSGLPVSYDFNASEIFMASASQMFVQEQLSGNYYRINLNINSGPPFTGTATNITSLLPSAFSISQFFAKNGRFYLFDSSTSPDQFAVSSDGGATWTKRNVPFSGTSMFFVTDNGYVFAVERFGAKIHLSKDNGATFAMTTLPSLDVSQSIEDIFIDQAGYVYLAQYEDVVYKSRNIVVPPLTPLDLQSVVTTSGTVALRWKDEALNEDFYTIERSTNGVDFIHVGTVDQGSMCQTPSSRGFFVDTDVAAATTYTYRVIAHNDAGTATSAVLVVATSSSCTDQTIPDGRSWTATNAGGNGFSATTVTNVGIRYLGNGVYDVQSIDMGLDPSTSSAVRGKFVLDCDKTVMLQDNNGSLRPNGVGTWNSGPKQITIKWALCDDLNSFETVTYTINADNTDPAPTTPVVQALVTGNSEVTISWTTGFNQKDFVVERSITSPSSGFSQIGGSSVVNYPSNSFTDPGPFTIGSPYYYRVTARNHNSPPTTAAGNAELVFARPNFVLSATEVTDFIGLPFGSYWGDFDGDGFDDLMTIDADVSGISAEVFIFRNLGTGDFTQAQITVDPKGYAGALLSDFNNDNKLDMMLFELDGSDIDLYQGNGDFTFVKLSSAIVGELATDVFGEVMSLSSADVNNDGTLDLLVCAGLDASGIEIPPQLFIRQANGSYTKSDGGDLALHPSTASATTWADFNNDGNSDVLAIDATTTKLYEGNGDGTFSDVTTSSGLVDNASSAAWGDYNADGFMDLYIGKTSNSVLYKNNGDGTFTRDATTSITNAETFAPTAPLWADVNNDSKLDFLTPGFSFSGSARTPLFINTTSGSTTTFNKITTEAISNTGVLTLGAATADYQKDGFLDLSMASWYFDGASSPGPANYNLYKNNNNTGNWVEVRLKGNPSNSQGIGARVKVMAGSTTTHRQVQTTTSQRSQNSTNLHFGLGAQASINSITVYWPSGLAQVYNNPPINTALTIAEDTQGPLVTLLAPSNGSAGVGVNAAVEITFDEPTVANGTKNIYVTRVADGSPVFTQSVSTGVKNGNKYTFTFGSPFQQLTQYAVTFDAGAFADVYGNQFGGLVSAWQFTTVQGPQVTALSPASNALNVPSNTTISITFNVPTTAVAGKVLRVYRNTDLTNPIRTIDASSAISNGNQQVFTPNPKLPTETALTVNIEAGAFKDAGNATAAGGQWSFTTDAGPAVVSASPISGSTNIPTVAPIEITFSRNLSAAVAGKHLRVMDGASTILNVDVSTTGTISLTKYTLTPVANWPTGKLLTVTLDPGAFVDAGGNDANGIQGASYTFTTELGPQITSRKPAISETGVSGTAVIEITFDKNIAAVTGKKIEVKDGATLVASSTVSTTGTVAGSKYTYPAPPGTPPTGGWPLGKVLTVTLEAGAFVDVNSNPSSAIAGSDWTFTTIAAPDQAPPTIAFTTLATVEKHALPSAFSATVQDNIGVLNTKLFIRPITGLQFAEVTGTGPTGSNIYTYTPASSPFDGIGAQYYFTAADASGNTTRNPQSGYFTTYVKYNNTTSVIPSGLVGSGGTQTSWKVISIPFDLGTNNAATAVFDELQGLSYKKDWRMLTLRPNPLAWADLNDGFTNIDRGIGYMINIKTPKTLAIGSDLTAPPNRRDNLFKLTLKAGWNMIGNPYLTNVNWDDVIAFNNLTGSAQIFKKFNNGNYSDIDLMAPFEGGFVQVASDVEVTIPFEGQVTIGGRKKEVVFQEGDWMMPITLHHDGLTNSFGGVGMHHESTNAFDALDNFNGPQFIDFIEMNFDHPGDFPKKFSRDVVNVADQYTWEFTLDASGVGLTQMAWDPHLNLNSDFELYLWDVTTQHAVNMREVGSYDFDPSISRKFKIFFGREARKRILPETGMLGQPYPNPSEGISYIPYSLPEGNPQYGVRIEVFDSMGRRVATIEEGDFAPGLYRTAWNPHDANANGLYTLRMTVVTGAAQEVYSGKILLNK